MYKIVMGWIRIYVGAVELYCKPKFSYIYKNNADMLGYLHLKISDHNESYSKMRPCFINMFVVKKTIKISPQRSLLQHLKNRNVVDYLSGIV